MKLGVLLLTVTLLATGFGLILYTFHYITILNTIGTILFLNGIVTIFYAIFSRRTYSRFQIFSWGAIVATVGIFLATAEHVSFADSFPFIIGIILVILGIVVVINEVRKV